jgi:hypothetical protein
MKELAVRSCCFLTALGLATVGFSPTRLLAQSLATTLTTSASEPTPGTLPPGILPSSPVAQVVRLVQAGVEENIVLSFVSNSISTFNLDSDKIIYLSDVGVPSNITTAMMQRDQVLQQQMAAAQTTQTAPPPSPPPASTTSYTTDTPDATDSTDTAPPPAPDSGPVTVNYFYTSLAPYGSWLDIAGYGPCWRPTVGVYNPGWQPYCDRGHWVDTEGGWYWESDYAWGTTFHYGRWFHHPHLGWCWWPNTVWAPSWVTWRYTDDYCGWAPLPPFSVYQPGVGFAYRGNGISVGFDFGLDEDCFTFVPTEHFCDLHPRRYRCAPDEVSRFYGQTAIINNLGYSHRIVVNNGIPAQHFNRPGGTPIQPVALHDVRIPPTFSQNPVILHAEHSPLQPGQSYAPRSGEPYQPNQGNRTWTANPGSSQPGVYNYDYNNEQRSGALGQVYNHAPQPPTYTQPQVYRQPQQPQYTPPPPAYRQPPVPPQNYQQPVYERHEPDPQQPVPEPSQPVRVEPPHNEPAPVQRSEPQQQQSQSQSSGSGRGNR